MQSQYSNALISKNFDLSGIKSLCNHPQVQVDYDDLNGNTKKIKSLALTQHMSMRGRMLDLFVALNEERPHLDLSPCFHELIAQQFSTAETMGNLFAALGLTVRDFQEPEKFAWGASAWCSDKARKLQTYCHQQGQWTQLQQTVAVQSTPPLPLEALQRLFPDPTRPAAPVVTPLTNDTPAINASTRPVTVINAPLQEAVKSNSQTRLTKGSDEEDNAFTKWLGKGNRWAVLVGVNLYDDYNNYGRLQVCVQDVKAIRQALIAGGYEPERIQILTDDGPEMPTRANVLSSLQAVANATEPGDSLLFYYSGHGSAVKDTSYLVARDGRFNVLRDTAVSVTRIKEIMNNAPARAKVIILDACHSGAQIGKGTEPMSAEFIRRVFEEAEGLVILASCKQGEKSYEWLKETRSVFTHYLLEAMSGKADRDQKGFVSIGDASAHIVNYVKLWASQQKVAQTPTLQTEIVGDVILSHYRRLEDSHKKGVQ